MDALLQIEIVDERKSRLERTGVESVGMLSVATGLTMSSLAENLQLEGRFTNRPIRYEDIISREASLFSLTPVFHRLTVRHPTSASFRDKELEWRRNHMQALRQFENEWVVLEGEDIVAHGSDPVEVIRAAKEKGISKPYVFFVEQKNEHVIKIGL